MADNIASLNHMPESAWQFDAEVVQCFEDMLERSIPQYHIMREAVTDIACTFARDHTYITDLGCSRGEALAPIVARRGKRNHYLGIEVSPPMLAAAHARFAAEDQVEIRNTDLRTSYPEQRASVTLSILTLQFTPIEHRQRIVRDIYKHTLPGGVLICVEKILGSSAELDMLMKTLYYNLKSANGYSEEAIERKRLALEGVLVPVTAKWNEELMTMAGFTRVECFWRWMNFAGWVALRDD